MVSKRWLGLCVLSLWLVPAPASADEPLTNQVQRRVEDGLVRPLAEKEKARSSFSRARRPPAERRVRVTDLAATSDPAGNDYVAFAIDVRYGADWRENDIVGCAYPKTGALFVKLGADYRPAAVFLGTDVATAPGVCVPKARS